MFNIYDMIQHSIDLPPLIVFTLFGLQVLANVIILTKISKEKKCNCKVKVEEEIQF